MCGLESIQSKNCLVTDYMSGLFHSCYVKELKECLVNLTNRVTSAVLAVFRQLHECNQFVSSNLQAWQRWTSETLKFAFGSITALFVLPSLKELTENERKDLQTKSDTFISSFNDKGISVASKVSFTAPDKSLLSTVTLIFPLTTNREQKTIVYLPGRKELWQGSLDFLSKLHEHTQANIHAINYRGTGGSRNFPANDDTIVNDAVAYVQELINKGIPRNRIALFGYDVGSAVAVRAAAKLADADININIDVIGDRGFSSLASQIREIFPVAGSFFARFSEQMDWGLNAEAALTKLQGRLICIYSEYDPFVPLACTLKSALDRAAPKSLKLRKIEIRLDEAQFALEHSNLISRPDYDIHQRIYTKTENTNIVDAIRNLWAVA